MLEKFPSPELPSEQESHHLLNLFLTWLGVNQHFFDPRAFVDTMTMLFLDDASRQRTIDSIWFVQYLLVMAMGKLMDFDTPVDTPHGLEYFAEAIRLMPPIHQLSDNGILAVEILSLVSLNLQWRERKYEAYFNVSVRPCPRNGASSLTKLSLKDRHCSTPRSDPRLRFTIRRPGAMPAVGEGAQSEGLVDSLYA